MTIPASVVAVLGAQVPVEVVVAGVGVLAALIGAAVGAWLGFSLDKSEQLRTLRIERYEQYIESYHRCALQTLAALNPSLSIADMPPSDVLTPFLEETFDRSTRVSLVAPREVAEANLKCDRSLQELSGHVMAKRRGALMTTDDHARLMETVNGLGIVFETVSARSLWGRKVGRELPED